MKIINTSWIDNSLLRKIINTTISKDLDLEDTTIKVKNSKKVFYAGRAYPFGCGISGTSGPLISVRFSKNLPKSKHYPYVSAYKKRAKIIILNWKEDVLRVLAHEIYHIGTYLKEKKSGVPPKLFKSEVNTERYAHWRIQKFRIQINK